MRYEIYNAFSLEIEIYRLKSVQKCRRIYLIYFQVIEDLNLHPDEVILGQGTLRPDLIESASGIASGQADVIKTHHNDTELVRTLRDQNRVVEPLSEFHKDEVSHFFG